MKKHLLTLFVACIVPLCSAAQATALIDGIKYYLMDGEATVMVQDETLSGDVVIPAAVSHEGGIYAVTGITTAAFAETDITSIELPDGITELPDNCFYRCYYLTSVTLPSGLKSIGSSCFESTRLVDISLPASLTSLGVSCFDGCGALMSIDLPSGITSLPDNCFSFCYDLETVTLPDGLVSIGEDCFRSAGIRRLSMPNSVTSVGNRCLEDCSELEHIELSEGLTSLSQGLFADCEQLKSITIPSKVDTIYRNCFKWCAALEEVVMPNSLTYLDERSFEGCSSLPKITLPNSLTYIGPYCFRDCTSLKDIKLPNGITSLSNFILWNCSSLESITIPSSVTKISDHAFSDCTALANVEMPEGVTEIGSGAFESCTALTGIVIPESVVSIGYGAFEECTSLFSVTVNWNSLDGINVASSVFSGSFSDSRLYVPKGTSDIYRTTAPWSGFKYIVEHDGGQTETKACDTPEISYEDGELVFSSATEGAEYHYTITSSDVTANAYSEDGRIQLAATYEISVYASADGYLNSETATATLCFIDADLTTTDIATAGPKRGIVITSAGGTVTVSGLDGGEQVWLYTPSGAMTATAKAGSDGTAVLNTGGTVGLALLKTGNNTVKIVIK